MSREPITNRIKPKRETAAPVNPIEAATKRPAADIMKAYGATPAPVPATVTPEPTIEAPTLMADTPSSRKAAEYPLNDKYAEFNALYFGGKLEAVPVKWGPLDGAHGVFKYARNRTTGMYAPGSGSITIDNLKQRTEEFLDGILLHEMCHVWVSQYLRNPNAPNGGHNDQFVAKIAEIQAKVPFLVPATEADDDGVTGVTELTPLTFLIATVDKLGAKQVRFVGLANREADTLADMGKAEANALLASVLDDFDMASAHATVVQVSDQFWSDWFLNTRGRYMIYDSLRSMKPESTKWLTSPLHQPRVIALMDGTATDGGTVRVLASVNAPTTAVSSEDSLPPAADAPVEPNPPAASPAGNSSDAFFPHMDKRHHPLPTDKPDDNSGYTYLLVGVTGRNTRPYLLATDDYDYVVKEAPNLIINLRALYPGQEHLMYPFAQALDDIAFGLEEKGATVTPYSVMGLRKAFDKVDANNSIYDMDRFDALAKWINSLNPTVDAVIADGKIGIHKLLDWLAEAVMDHIVDTKHLRFLADSFGAQAQQPPMAYLFKSLEFGNARSKIISFLCAFPPELLSNMNAFLRSKSLPTMEGLLSQETLWYKWQAHQEAMATDRPPLTFKTSDPDPEPTPTVTPAPALETLYTNPQGAPYDKYSFVVSTSVGPGYLKLVAPQTDVEADAMRPYIIIDRNNPKYIANSAMIAIMCQELDAIMKRFSIPLDGSVIKEMIDIAVRDDNFELLDRTNVASLEQWYEQWFGEKWTYDVTQSYTRALLQLSGAIGRAERDDSKFNRYALNEMQLGDMRDNGVRNQGLLAQLMQKFGSSTDSLGLWLMNLPIPMRSTLLMQGKINYEAISYVFAQTSVATLWERFNAKTTLPAPDVKFYSREALIAQGYKGTGITYAVENKTMAFPTQAFLQQAHNKLGVKSDEIACFRIEPTLWEVFLRPDVVSPVLEPEVTVRAPKVRPASGERSNLQMAVDPVAKRLVLQVEPAGTDAPRNLMGQVNKREARPIAALLNVLLAEDFDDVLTLIQEKDRKAAAVKMANIATRLTPFFKKTVADKQPFGALQPWITANFGEGLAGQKAAMLAFEGKKARLTPAQKRYLTYDKNRLAVLKMLNIKPR